MAVYLDTSAFLKLVVEEEHSASMLAWVERNDSEVFSSDLLRTEALRAARRYSVDALAEARRRLDAVTLISLPTGIFERAAELDPAILRGLDALHLAAALTLADELDGVVTYDERLTEAAVLHGVAVITPLDPATPHRP